MIKNIYFRYKRRTKKALFLLSYFLLRHRRAIAKLSSYGFADIRIYRLKLWKANCKYYQADMDGEKCFIKVSTDCIAAKNEIFINKYLAGCGFSFVPMLLLSDESYDSGEFLLVTEFKSNMRVFSLPEDEKAFELICAEFENIHGLFRQFDIIHGDLFPGNLRLDADNHICIIDFGVGWVPGSGEYPEEYLYRGVNTGSAVVYDNARAFLNMLEDCGISNAFKQKECYKRIERLVGAHTYTVEL